MAMIRKNRDTVEEIVKLFFCEGKDRRFQIRYLRSMLNLDLNELNLILGSIFKKQKGKFYYLKCRNDDLCVCEETLLTVDSPRYTNKSIRAIDFDLKDYIIFGALNTCNENSKGVSIPRYIYVFEDLLKESDEQRLQLGFFNFKYRTNLTDDDMNALLSEAINEGYKVDYSFENDTIIFGLKPRQLPKYIGMHDRLTFTLRNIH